jgi:hypothetical protein
MVTIHLHDITRPHMNIMSSDYIMKCNQSVSH